MTPLMAGTARGAVRILGPSARSGVRALPSRAYGTRNQTLAKKPGANAFTLLEICFVLFIIALFLGATAVVSSGMINESRLREPARKLQVFAKTARRMAMTEGQSYALKLSNAGFSVQALPQEKDIEENEAAAEKPPSEETETPEPLDLHYGLGSAIHIEVRRWDEKEWHKKVDESWVFQPSGLCEPIQVRFSLDESWLSIVFNPLTAAIEEETYEFR